MEMIGERRKSTRQETRLTWALWNYDWKPERTGEYKLAVRATDGDGTLQIKEERWTAPHGATWLSQSDSPRGGLKFS